MDEDLQDLIPGGLHQLSNWRPSRATLPAHTRPPRIERNVRFCRDVTMARTPLLNMLLNLSRERAMAERSERAGNRPGSTAIGRRTVLRGAAGIALASAQPLAGLAATARIAVVGAGLAGLTAARELRKAGLSPDVYEGSTRIGGRCYSARGIFGDGQVAEHGGEFIDSDHKEIRELAKDLGLILDDVLKAKPPNTRSLYLFNDKPYNLADATRDWQPL